MTKWFTALKTLLFVVLVPGTVTLIVPWLLVRPRWAALAPLLSPRHAAGAALVAGGAALGLWCAGLFTFVGRGTPAPIDPPKVLVAVGAYRFTRNPMYVAVTAILLGEALFLWSPALALYTVLVCTAFHTFVVCYEEPALRKQFGTSYEEYCRTVPRWLPPLRK